LLFIEIKVYGSFFFAEETVTGLTYLDRLGIWLLLQMNENSEDFIFQQDGAPPLMSVSDFLVIDWSHPHI
jgi:hypothetical protein